MTAFEVRRRARSSMRRQLDTARSASMVMIVVAGVVVVSVSLALVVPAIGVLPGLGGSVGLNRTAQVQGRLSQRFVRSTLGLPGLRNGAQRTAFAAGGVGGRPASAPAVGQVVHHAFTNNQFENAVKVVRLPFTATTNTNGATRQSGEPSSCAVTGGTAWYRYIATDSSTLFADTFGTTYRDALGVFTGTGLGHLHQVACGSSTAGQSQAGFRAARGTTYWFQITGVLDNGGYLAFHLLRLGPTTAVYGPSPVLLGETLSANGRWLAYVGEPAPGTPGVPTCAGTQGVHPCQTLFISDLRTGRARALLSDSTHLLIDPLNHGSLAPSAWVALHSSTDELSISAKGHFVSFDSDDPNLVPGDTNGHRDVFRINTRTRRIVRVSVSTTGQQAHFPPASTAHSGAVTLLYGVSLSAGSYGAQVTDGGRYVTFESDATNLVPGQTSGAFEVYRRDMRTGRTVLVSRGRDGRAISGDSFSFPVDNDGEVGSADGRFSLFETTSTRPACTNAVAATSACLSFWVWDSKLGYAVPQSIGRLALASLLAFAMSENGREIGLIYAADNNSVTVSYQYYEIRRGGDHPRLVSIDPASSNGAISDLSVVGPLSGVSGEPPFLSMSRTGRFISFVSDSHKLVPGDTNNAPDVFVRDMHSGSTVRASLTPEGRQFNDPAVDTAISASGRVVSFTVALVGAEGATTAGSQATVYVHRSAVAGGP